MPLAFADWAVGPPSAQGSIDETETRRTTSSASGGSAPATAVGTFSQVYCRPALLGSRWCSRFIDHDLIVIASGQPGRLLAVDIDLPHIHVELLAGQILFP